jgi:hypothetical protein
MPIMVLKKKSVVACDKENCPVITAASAKRSTIKLDASFTKLSPSNIVVIRFGTVIFLSTDVAAIASGGETIPPTRKPIARVKPGIIEEVIKATAKEVIITNPNANRLIGLRHFQKSFQEVYQAASYNNGGKKIKNITSGSIDISGIPGM